MQSSPKSLKSSSSLEAPSSMMPAGSTPLCPIGGPPLLPSMSPLLDSCPPTTLPMANCCAGTAASVVEQREYSCTRPSGNEASSATRHSVRTLYITVSSGSPSSGVSAKMSSTPPLQGFQLPPAKHSAPRVISSPELRSSTCRKAPAAAQKLPPGSGPHPASSTNVETRSLLACEPPSKSNSTCSHLDGPTCTDGARTAPLRTAWRGAGFRATSFILLACIPCPSMTASVTPTLHASALVCPMELSHPCNADVT
mmetsp:Transcript_49986/g.99274  ORF Transcript_49986/g.99274 Transcript_49986/m.99274 type:complete len:254 (-) Transcript_49986:27-788(-)